MRGATLTDPEVQELRTTDCWSAHFERSLATIIYRTKVYSKVCLGSKENESKLFSNGLRTCHQQSRKVHQIEKYVSLDQSTNKRTFVEKISK
jgi:hypothetical protein